MAVQPCCHRSFGNLTKCKPFSQDTDRELPSLWVGKLKHLWCIFVPSRNAQMSLHFTPMEVWAQHLWVSYCFITPWAKLCWFSLLPHKSFGSKLYQLLIFKFTHYLLINKFRFFRIPFVSFDTVFQFEDYWEFIDTMWRDAEVRKYKIFTFQY